MTKVLVDITMSLDGYVAGPNPTNEEPLGKGGEQLHDWIVELSSWRETHGKEGGVTSADDELFKETYDAVGAYVMGRRMFSGGDGPWDADPVADGWWGDDPPFRAPVFVVTHHPREPVAKENGTRYVFVTEGVPAALEQARAAAEGKNVLVAGGASVAQQTLAAGLLDELRIHVAPLLLGGGIRLLDNLDPEGVKLELVRAIDSPKVTHLKYRAVRG